MSPDRNNSDRRSEDVKRLQPDHGRGMFNKGAVLILEPDDARRVHHALRHHAWHRRQHRLANQGEWTTLEFEKWTHEEARLTQIAESILEQQADACFAAVDHAA